MKNLICDRTYVNDVGSVNLSNENSILILNQRDIDRRQSSNTKAYCELLHVVITPDTKHTKLVR